VSYLMTALMTATLFLECPEAAVARSVPWVRMAAVAMVACTAALAVSCATSSGPVSKPTETATPAGPQPCATHALRITLGPWNGAGAGNFYRPLDFTNISRTNCTLLGYPSVSFATRTGTEVGTAAGRIPARTLLVLLAPGASAHATLDLHNMFDFSCPLTRTSAPVNRPHAGLGGQGACERGTAAGLRSDRSLPGGPLSISGPEYGTRPVA